MSSGVFAVARNIFEHDFFEDEPFTEREAWLWLIREAAWKDRRVRVGKKLCELKRGQLATSMRFMAGKWKWSEARVRRFLNRLKIDAMIVAESDALATQITICNYDDYQKVSLPSDAANDSAPDAAATQQRRSSDANKNTGENIKSIEEKEPLRGAAPMPAKSIDARVFELGVTVFGGGKKSMERQARSLTGKLRKACEYDDEYALSLVQEAATKHDPVSWISGAIRSVDLRPYRGVAGYEMPDSPAILSKEDRAYKAWEKRYYQTVL